MRTYFNRVWGLGFAFSRTVIFKSGPALEYKIYLGPLLICGTIPLHYANRRSS